MIPYGGPKNYGSFADFEREELRPLQKVGFSVEDLEAEAHFQAAHEDFVERQSEELDFD